MNIKYLYIIIYQKYTLQQQQTTVNQRERWQPACPLGCPRSRDCMTSVLINRLWHKLPERLWCCLFTLLIKNWTENWLENSLYLKISRNVGVGPPIRGATITKGPPFSAISSSDNLRLGIRLGLVLGSVVWLWQHQELYSMQRPWMTACRMADLSKWRPFGMADRNRNVCSFARKLVVVNRKCSD